MHPPATAGGTDPVQVRALDFETKRACDREENDNSETKLLHTTGINDTLGYSSPLK